MENVNIKSTLDELGKKLLEARGRRGIRAVAEEMDVSPSTLSRIERGFVPDLETFTKICKWLNINPGEILNPSISHPIKPRASVHFKKQENVKPETANALAQLIIAAQRAIEEY